MNGFVVERGGAADSRATLTGGLRKVAGDALRIGRGTNADLRFEDAAVALEHARLERRADGLFAVDLGSVTGTYVNGRAIFEKRLEDGDEIEIGGHDLKVHLREGAPVVVSVAAEPAATAAPGAVAETAPAAAPESPAAPPPDAAPAPDAAPVPLAAAVAGAAAGTAVAARPVDYVAAYGLRRGWFGKTAVALACLAAALAAVAWVSRPQQQHLFRPGEISSTHKRSITAWTCDSCHRPWQGSVDALCGECHAANEVDHQPTQAAAPGCTACHSEHRGEAFIQVVEIRDCTVCHADLETAPGATPRFATAVASFEDHPEFALDTPAGRLPAAEANDPGTVALDHAVHLAPDLLSPEAPGGRETLTCDSCHRVADGGVDLAPIDYDLHCARCHRLNFDPEFPPVEHRAPRAVRSEIRDYYSGDYERQVSVAEERRRAVTGRRRAPRPLSGRTLEDRVLIAEDGLLTNACVICHRIDLEATPYPLVAAPAMAADWLPYSHFSHDTHLRLSDETCADCHPAAAASKATADVLLPSISVCLPCHGETAAVEETRAFSACADCHSYHPKTLRERVAASGG